MKKTDKGRATDMKECEVMILQMAQEILVRYTECESIGIGEILKDFGLVDETQYDQMCRVIQEKRNLLKERK